VRIPFLVAALLALAAVGTVLGAAFYFGVIGTGGGVASASQTPRPSVSFVPVAPTPTAQASAAASPTAVPPSPNFSPGGTYVVQAGDLGLSVIAAKFGIPWQLIAEANNIPGPNYTIHVGDVLIIPVLPQPSDGSQAYVVASGDNVTKIATKFGVDPTDLADFNNIADWNSIQVGQILYIPGPGWTPRPTESPTPK
jgi:LysM repeat protein